MGVNIGGRNMGASIGTRSVMSMSDNPPLPIPTNRVATVANEVGSIGTFKTKEIQLTAGWYEFLLRGGGGGGGSGAQFYSDGNGIGGAGGDGGNGTTVRFNTNKRCWFINVLDQLEVCTGEIDIVAGGGGGGAGGRVEDDLVSSGSTGPGGAGGGNAGGSGGGGQRAMSWCFATDTRISTGANGPVTGAEAYADNTICGSSGGAGGTLGAPGKQPVGVGSNIPELGPKYGGTNAFFTENGELLGNGDTTYSSGGGYPAGGGGLREYLQASKIGIGPKGTNLKADDTKAYQGGHTTIYILDNQWYNLNNVFGTRYDYPGGGEGGNGGAPVTNNTGLNALSGDSGGNGAKIKCIMYIPEPVTITLRTGGGGAGGVGVYTGSNGYMGGNGSAQIYKLG